MGCHQVEEQESRRPSSWGQGGKGLWRAQQAVSALAGGAGRVKIENRQRYDSPSHTCPQQ